MGGAALVCRHLPQLLALIPVANSNRREPHQRAIAGGIWIGGPGERLA
jgi:hypothetical protein